jgi:Domain of unknown function (DUF4390)
MPCLDAVCQLAGRRIAQCRGSALVVLLCMLLLCLGARTARAQGVEVLDLQASRDEVAVSLEYQLRVTLPSTVEAAVERGVPLYFTAQASLMRPRWYWRDERAARVSREWRLSFQPLTSTWRVSQGGLGQSFASLAEALSAMTRSTGWRIADTRDVEPDGRHYIEFSWRLDTSQLPRPLQIGLGGIGGASEWSLGVERSFKLTPETPK